VSVKEGRFSGVWPANESFFQAVRNKGGLIGVAVDPLTGHECGNQRYLAIPWIDACLQARLPRDASESLQEISSEGVWLADPTGFESYPASEFQGDPLRASWLLNESIARAWMQYVKDTSVVDLTPPPAPTELTVDGGTLRWNAEADTESGLASFLIERDGQIVASVPEDAKNPFGRTLFQNLQYSDTPSQPLVTMQYVDPSPAPGKEHRYRVIAVNTVGLRSE
jgi:hypothetical protein